MTADIAATQVLLDSDALIALLNQADVHHLAASQRFTRLKQQRLAPIITSLVVLETATGLSYRVGPALARQFLDFVRVVPVIHITPELQEKALALFTAQADKGTSIVDCVNAVVMEQFAIPYIFSFDTFYERRLGLKIVA